MTENLRHEQEKASHKRVFRLMSRPKLQTKAENLFISLIVKDSISKSGKQQKAHFGERKYINNENQNEAKQVNSNRRHTKIERQ